jgi:hypothetical protein
MQFRILRTKRNVINGIFSYICGSSIQLFLARYHARLYILYPFLGYVLGRCSFRPQSHALASRFLRMHLICCRLTYAPCCHHMYHVVRALTEHILSYHPGPNASSSLLCLLQHVGENFIMRSFVTCTVRWI